MGQNGQMKEKDSLVFTNKVIPPSLEKEIKIALSYYPELKDTPITFNFKDDIKKSFMQAQPNKWDLFSKRKDTRGYHIDISRNLVIDEKDFPIQEVPEDVLIGWIGHELGHVMDYKNKSGMGMVIFGLRYITSGRFLEEAERAADTYAVNHGMGYYILETKNFILHEANLSDEYISKIKKWYLSPEEIMVMIEDLKKEDNSTETAENS